MRRKENELNEYGVTLSEGCDIMRSVNKDGRNVAIIEQSYKIDSAQDALDLMASVYYQVGSDAMVIYKESILKKQ